MPNDDERPQDIQDRTFRCESCGAIMLRAAADWREEAPYCPICEESLAEGRSAQLGTVPA